VKHRVADGVREPAERPLFLLARILEQGERLVRVGCDDDAIEALHVAAQVAQLDAVRKSRDPADAGADTQTGTEPIGERTDVDLAATRHRPPRETYAAPRPAIPPPTIATRTTEVRPGANIGS
jgi:hypothetical protein